MRLAAAGLVAAMALGLLGCADDEPPELTVEQHLIKLAGRPLTRTEIDEQLALADLLCQFDRRLLEEIWSQLDARQLEFQDFVFGEHCPDRISFYEELRPDTGTVPPGDRTTSTTAPTTTNPPRTIPASSTTNPPPEHLGSSTTSTSSSTTSTTRRATTSTEGS